MDFCGLEELLAAFESEGLNCQMTLYIIQLMKDA